jgi:hypothetical protein
MNGNSYNEETFATRTQNTMDTMEASTLSAAIATLQTEVRLEPLMALDDGPKQPKRYRSLDRRETSHSRKSGAQSDWMFGAMQVRGDIKE